MNYIKKDSKIYEVTERECSIVDLEFHKAQLQTQINTLNDKIAAIEKL